MIPLTLAVYYGLGRHTGELTFPQLFVAAKWFYITLMIALAAVVFAKFTIIALLLTMHGITARKKRLALYFLAFLLVSTSTLPLAMILSHCKPVQKLWDLGLDGTCQSLGPYGDIAVFHGCKSYITLSFTRNTTDRTSFSSVYRRRSRFMANKYSLEFTNAKAYKVELLSFDGCFYRSHRCCHPKDYLILKVIV